MASQKSVESHVQSPVSVLIHVTSQPPCPPMLLRERLWNRIWNGLLLHIATQNRHLRAPQGGFEGKRGVTPRRRCSAHSYAKPPPSCSSIWLRRRVWIRSLESLLCAQSRKITTFVLPTVATQKSMESHLEGAVSGTDPQDRHFRVLFPKVVSQKSMEMHLEGAASAHNHTDRYLRVPQGCFAGEYGIAFGRDCFSTRSRKTATFVLVMVASQESMTCI